MNSHRDRKRCVSLLVQDLNWCVAVTRNLCESTSLHNTSLASKYELKPPFRVIRDSLQTHDTNDEFADEEGYIFQIMPTSWQRAREDMFTPRRQREPFSSVFLVIFFVAAYVYQKIR